MDYRTIIDDHAGRPFWESSARRLTFAELDREVARWRGFLKGKGLKEGDVVARPLYSLAEAVGLPFACWSMNLLFMPLDPRLKADSLDHVTEQTPVNLWLREEDVPGDGIIAAGGDFNFNLFSNRPSLIILTSGSGGYAKCAALSRANVFLSAQSVAQYFSLYGGDRWLHVLPDFHIGGLAVWLRCFVAGATVVSRRKVTEPLPESLTHMSLVAAQLQSLLEKGSALPRLRAVLLGGSAISTSLTDKALRADLPLYSSYGLTEMASTVAVKKHFAPRDMETVDAELLPGREVRIVDGEILLRGEVLFAGYFKAKKLTGATDEAGWFATGDLGLLKQNRLTVLGRRDNMFISGGENIRPEEIERHLLHIPGIEAAMIVPWPDSRFGHRPVAVIHNAAGHSAGKIKTILAEKLPSFKIPRDFFGWPAGGAAGIKWRRAEILTMLEKGNLSPLE